MEGTAGSVIRISYFSLCAAIKCIFPPPSHLFACHLVKSIIWYGRKEGRWSLHWMQQCNTLVLWTSHPLIPLITSYNFAEGEQAAVCSRIKPDCDSADLMDHLASHFSANGIAWKSNIPGSKMVRGVRGHVSLFSRPSGGTKWVSLW